MPCRATPCRAVPCRDAALPARRPPVPHRRAAPRRSVSHGTAQTGAAPETSVPLTAPRGGSAPPPVLSAAVPALPRTPRAVPAPRRSPGRFQTPLQCPHAAPQRQRGPQPPLRPRQAALQAEQPRRHRPHEQQPGHARTNGGPAAPSATAPHTAPGGGAAVLGGQGGDTEPNGGCEGTEPRCAQRCRGSTRRWARTAAQELPAHTQPCTGTATGDSLLLGHLPPRSAVRGPAGVGGTRGTPRSPNLSHTAGLPSSFAVILLSGQHHAGRGRADVPQPGFVSAGRLSALSVNRGKQSFPH